MFSNINLNVISYLEIHTSSIPVTLVSEGHRRCIISSVRWKRAFDTTEL